MENRRESSGVEQGDEDKSKLKNKVRRLFAEDPEAIYTCSQLLEAITGVRELTSDEKRLLREGHGVIASMVYDREITFTWESTYTASNYLQPESETDLPEQA